MSAIARDIGEVLFVVNELRFFRIHLLSIAQAIRDLGFEVRVIGAEADRAKQEIDRVQDLGFSVDTMRLSRSGARPWEELRTTISIRRVISTNPPVLMHNAGFKAVVDGTHAAWLSPSPPAVINHVTGLGHMYAVDGLRERVSRKIMNLGFASAFRVVEKQRIIVLNPDDRRLLISEAGAPLSKLRLIRGSGVNTDRFRRLDEGEDVRSDPLVLFVGRLLWTKGVESFVETARWLREEFESTRWVIVGEPDEGNLSSVPKETVKRWASEPNIEWWGWRDDMEHVYQCADIICLPTLREGVPTVLTEAAACEVPIVATDVPGCREIVRDGENGFLVPPGDARALRKAVRRLLDNPGICRRMGTRGRELVKREFSEARVVEQTLDVYKELLIECGTEL